MILERHISHYFEREYGPFLSICDLDTNGTEAIVFGKEPERRPYYGVLGDANVVGGLYRDPHKVQIPLNYFSDSEITFMCPDHFHLVGLSKTNVKRYFGYQTPKDYSEEKYPYYQPLVSIHRSSDLGKPM